MQEENPGPQKHGSFARLLLVLCTATAIVMAAVALAGVAIVRKAISRFHRAPAAQSAVMPMEQTVTCAPLSKEDAAAIRTREKSGLVPIAPDMVLDSVSTVSGADLETLTRISSVSDTEIKLTLSQPTAREENGRLIVEPGEVMPAFPQCQADLATSHVLVTEGNADLSVPLIGVTRNTLSQEVYQDLKSGKPFSFEYRRQYYPVATGYSWKSSEQGTLQTDASSATYKLILNSAQTELPALRAKGELNGMPSELTVLDDAANPLLLDLQIPSLHVAWHTAKINYPVATIERELGQTGRAVVYGIYFDFNRPVLRVESEPVLNEIAEALRKHGEWHVSIENYDGSTAPENKTLSDQRAAAVKQALVNRYALAPERMFTTGHGASQPKASNDSVQGRAINRRIELVKQ